MAADQFKNTWLFIDQPLGSDKLFLRSFSGEETISKIFKFQLDFLSLDQNINFDDILGKKVTIGVNLADGTSQRFWNGYISRFSQLPGAKVAIYQAELVPWFWFLTRQYDCRIFQDATVPDIVFDVFDRMGQSGYLDMRVKSSDYRKWDYCVQYRESSANFVMRLLEQEGIFFYFTHEKGQHKMVIADAKSKIDPCQNDAVPFVPSGFAGSKHLNDEITSWQTQVEVRSGKYTLNDFNFEDSSSTLLKVSSEAKHGGDTRWEVYDYPGEYDTHDEGSTLADVYMDAEELPHLVVNGDGVCRSLAPGLRFDLKNHPRADQNGTYLLTSVSHSGFESEFFSGGGNGSSTYSNSFTSIPVKVPFTPPRTTPKPLMQGSQTAIVVGPKGEEIYTDKYGRVKVQFHWDRETQRKKKDIPDEERSCFIRVSQPWAGTNWGSIFLPRIGQEVIVDFLEGDPDQPIITGRVYNDKNMPPYKLPDNQTRSGVMTRSTPKGSSSTFNSIIFEDKKGSELLRIHAERSMTESVEADSREYVGHDRLTTIGNDRKTHIKQNDNLHVEGFYRLLTDKDTSIHNKGGYFQKTEGPFCIDVGGGGVLHFDKLSFNVDQFISINGPGGFIKIDASGVTIMGTMVMINSGGTPSVTAPIPPDDPDEPDEKHGGVKNS
ncbi:MAG: type VI secretion system tip protein TssI/VgrG [Candidatus Acidiferrum sp.]